jgi:hypothetical protein
MFRFLLAVIILATAALGPAAAFAPSHAPIMTGEDHQDCECCEGSELGAAMACAAFCHAALPSLLPFLPQCTRADAALSFLLAERDGMTPRPPAPPPRR